MSANVSVAKTVIVYYIQFYKNTLECQINQNNDPMSQNTRRAFGFSLSAAVSDISHPYEQYPCSPGFSLGQNDRPFTLLFFPGTMHFYTCPIFILTFNL